MRDEHTRERWELDDGCEPGDSPADEHVQVREPCLYGFGAQVTVDSGSYLDLIAMQEKLNAHDAMLSELRDLEWVVDYGTRLEEVIYRCPSCQKGYYTTVDLDDRSHDNGCTLAAAIAKATGENG